MTNNSQPKEIQDKINRIKKEMLDKTNMTENEAYDFAFKCWQCGLDFTKDLEKENQEQFRNTFKNHSNETEKFVDELWEENCKYKNAIEIIKSKNVDIFFLVNNCEFVLDNYNYEIEDDIMKYCYKDCSTLTQQECDLLKEVLE